MQMTTGRRVLLVGTQLLLVGMLLFSTYLVVHEAWSTVWGMATGNHFQAYGVVTSMDNDLLPTPRAAVPGASVRGPAPEALLRVGVDFGQGWSAWLALHGLKVAVVGGAVIAGTVLLLRILSAVGSGEPFSDANARRLRRLGLLCLVVPVVRFGIDVAQQALPPLVDGEGVLGVGLVPNLDLNLVATGLVLVILGEVWRHAATIRAGHERTASVAV